jgi:hypothetical protein
MTSAVSAGLRVDRSPGRHRTRWRQLVPVGLLAALSALWSALPARSGAGPAALLIVALVSAACSLIELAVRGVAAPANVFEPAADRLTRYALSFLRAVPWAEVLIIAAAVLEAIHPARPWHTAVLGVALLGYLFAIHLAERGDGIRLILDQLPVIAAGIGLAVLAAGAAALPGLPASPAAAAVRIVAAAGAVFAAAMVIPTWMTRDR